MTRIAPKPHATRTSSDYSAALYQHSSAVAGVPVHEFKPLRSYPGCAHPTRQAELDAHHAALLQSGQLLPPRERSAKPGKVLYFGKAAK